MTNGGRHVRRGGAGPVLVALVVLLALGGLGFAAYVAVVNRHPTPTITPAPPPTSTSPTDSPATSPTPTPTPTPPFGVGLKTLTFTDTSRTIPGGGPRVLRTWIYYPSTATTTALPQKGAPPQTNPGRYPLVVFGPGYDIWPTGYQQLLMAWARQGYVVAAPAFPLESPDAPGGPTESDERNQPADMGFVITQMLKLNGMHSSALYQMVDPKEIAAAGHSDGANTALALTYASCCRDPRIDASVILAGQMLTGKPLYAKSYFTGGRNVPMLAVQGSADTVNQPFWSQQIYSMAHPPKYLLWLTGAAHLGPFGEGTVNGVYFPLQPQYFQIVKQVSLAFLNHYLKHMSTKVAVTPPNPLAKLSASP
jgi:dienelactone hydrolase